MLTIGAFARLGGVSVRTLRHYEAVGVLLPEATDPTTGYRYYRVAQLARLHRIQALKDLGLSLQQLQPLLDNLSADELAGMLALTRAQLADRVAEDQGRLARVEQRLRYIELEDHVSIDIITKRIPETRVAQIRYAGDEGLDFSTMQPFVREAFASLGASLEEAAIQTEGPWFLHYDERTDGTVTPFVAATIGEHAVIDDDRVECVVLPAFDAAVTVFEGVPSHDAIGPLYMELARYAEDHGYQICSVGRDCLLGNEDGKAVMELQLPIGREDGSVERS